MPSWLVRALPPRAAICYLSPWSVPLRLDCSGDMVLASALSIVIQNICPKGVRVRFYCMAGETARHQQFSSDEIACFQQLV